MKCLSCNEDKHESEFHKSSNSMRPTNYMCLDCYAEYHRQHAIDSARKKKEDIAEREHMKKQRIEREAKAAALEIQRAISRTSDKRVKATPETQKRMRDLQYQRELNKIDEELGL